MLLINAKESELVKTLVIMLNMSNKESTLELFQKRFSEAPEDPDAAFHYGICLAIYLTTCAKPSDYTKYQLEINQVLSAALRRRKDWWFARYLRCEVLQDVAEGFFQMSQKIKSDNYVTITPDEDRLLLIDQQVESGLDVPYFLCPYVSHALSLFYQDSIPMGEEFLHKGLKAVTLKRSPFQLRLLMQPFVNISKFLNRVGMTELYDEMEHAKQVLFPSVGR